MAANDRLLSVFSWDDNAVQSRRAQMEARCREQNVFYHPSKMELVSNSLEVVSEQYTVQLMGQTRRRETIKN